MVQNSLTGFRLIRINFGTENKSGVEVLFLKLLENLNERVRFYTFQTEVEKYISIQEANTNNESDGSSIQDGLGHACSYHSYLHCYGLLIVQPLTTAGIEQRTKQDVGMAPHLFLFYVFLNLF